MSTMLLNRNTSKDFAVHCQNVQVLLKKIAEADAIDENLCIPTELIPRCPPLRRSHGDSYSSRAEHGSEPRRHAEIPEFSEPIPRKKAGRAGVGDWMAHWGRFYLLSGRRINYEHIRKGDIKHEAGNHSLYANRGLLPRKSGF